MVDVAEDREYCTSFCILSLDGYLHSGNIYSEMSLRKSNTFVVLERGKDWKLLSIPLEFYSFPGE